MCKTCLLLVFRIKTTNFTLCYKKSFYSNLKFHVYFKPGSTEIFISIQRRLSEEDFRKEAETRRARTQRESELERVAKQLINC